MKTHKLTDLVEANGITVRAVHVGTNTDDNGWRHNAWKATLVYPALQTRCTVTFSTGLAIKEPTAADVLYSLCSDARAGEVSFSEFCSEFGYDEDSRKAESIWRACKRSVGKARRFLKDDFDLFASAEH